MPSPPPVPPAARSPFGPEGEPKNLQDVSHRVRHAAERQRRAAEPATDRPAIDWTGPLLKLAAAAFAGYALGTIVHARAEAAVPATPKRPRTPPVHRPSRADARPSGLRFR